MVGEWYFWALSRLQGALCVISASGFFTELGCEIYLQDATKNAEKMLYTMLDADLKHNLLG